MPTPDELREFDEDQGNVRVLLISSLVAYWQDSVEANPAEALDGLRDFVLTAVQEYGQASAAIAVDFYNSVRPTGSPAFSATPVVRPDLVGGGSLNWATEPLLTEEWQTSLDRISAEIQKAAYQAAVETIGEATDSDPLDVRFARWPGNPEPCAWCVLRASRGAVYWSETTAERGDHIKCGCKVTPVFPGEPLPYRRKPYMTQYLAGASEASDDIAAATPGNAKRKALLSGMRRANGSR